MSVVRSRPTGAHSAMAAMLDLRTALSDLAEIHGEMSRGASKQHIDKRTFEFPASESCEDTKSLWGTALGSINRALGRWIRQLGLCKASRMMPQADSLSNSTVEQCRGLFDVSNRMLQVPLALQAIQGRVSEKDPISGASTFEIAHHKRTGTAILAWLSLSQYLQRS